MSMTIVVLVEAQHSMYKQDILCDATSTTTSRRTCTGVYEYSTSRRRISRTRGEQWVPKITKLRHIVPLHCHTVPEPRGFTCPLPHLALALFLLCPACAIQRKQSWRSHSYAHSFGCSREPQTDGKFLKTRRCNGLFTLNILYWFFGPF